MSFEVLRESKPPCSVIGMVLTIVLSLLLLGVGIVFAFLLITGRGNDYLLGTLLAVEFLLAGLALVLYARIFVVFREVAEDREEPLLMVTESFENKDAKGGVTRRRLTLGILLASAAGAFASLLSLLKVLAPEKKGGGYVATVATGDQLVYAQGGRLGTPLHAADLQVGDAVLVYPQNKTKNQANLVQLIRLQEDDLKAADPPESDRSGVCRLQRHLHPSRLHRLLGRKPEIARRLSHRMFLSQQHLQSGTGGEGHGRSRTDSTRPDRRQGVAGRNAGLYQRLHRPDRPAGMTEGGNGYALSMV